MPGPNLHSSSINAMKQAYRALGTTAMRQAPTPRRMMSTTTSSSASAIPEALPPTIPRRANTLHYQRDAPYSYSNTFTTPAFSVTMSSSAYYPSGTAPPKPKSSRKSTLTTRPSPASTSTAPHHPHPHPYFYSHSSASMSAAPAPSSPPALSHSPSSSSSSSAYPSTPYMAPSTPYTTPSPYPSTPYTTLSTPNMSSSSYISTTSYSYHTLSPIPRSAYPPAPPRSHNIALPDVTPEESEEFLQWMYWREEQRRCGKLRDEARRR